MSQKTRLCAGLLCALFLAAAAGISTAPSPIALLGVRNYSGTARAGSVDLAKRVSEAVMNAYNKQEPGGLLSAEQTRKQLASAGLEEFAEVINLCTDGDLRRVGARIGAGRVAFLTIEGFSEIKREGARKTYQVQLGLAVLDSAGEGDGEYRAEGLGESVTKAVENAAKNLVSECFSLPATANLGNKRDENLPVVGNAQSRQFHLPDCRHLPIASDRCDYPNHQAAEEDGFKPCLICFPRMLSGRAYDRSLEESLGRTACGEIEYYYRRDHNPEVIARLERVAAPLVAETTRYNVDYRFCFLDDREINAFSAPNGYIYVTRGLMEIIESDDELAFVIAHEMSHIERKHTVIRYKQAMALAIIGSVLAANSDTSSEAIMVAVTVEIILKGNSREHEKEADEAAISRLKRAGLDWRSYRSFFGRLMDLRERRVLALQAVFGTHPTPEARTENLDKMIELYEGFLRKL